MKDKLTSFLLAVVLALVTVNCGGGSTVPTVPPPPPPPPSNLSITTAALPNGMLTFAYSQTIQASGGVAPFSWTISSGSLPHGVTLGASATNVVTISGMPDTAQTAAFSVQVKDATNGSANQSYAVNISKLVSVQMQQVTGQPPTGVIEIQGLSASAFNPLSWQENTLNWVPDVRMPMLAPLTSGPCQNIYAPWALEQSGGWRMFYGGWDGATTCDDNIYSVDTPDFLAFNNRIEVIDHGAFRDVNNDNVIQLSDGSMHMICTSLNASNTVNGDKPAYFASPDGVTWNGTPEPYSAQLSDVVSIPNDPSYSSTAYDLNGGNVLLWDGNAWILYYSTGSYGYVYRAATSSPPVFQKTGVALNSVNYFDDVKKFSVGGKNWYLAALYSEVPTAPLFTFSLSNDGVTFGPEQNLFVGASVSDKFLLTPSFVTKGSSILGVLYGASAAGPLTATNQIFARWLQKQLVITDSTGAKVAAQAAYGPDRLWIQAPSSGPLSANVSVYAEDGVTPLGKGAASLNAGQAYMLVLQ